VPLSTQDSNRVRSLMLQPGASATTQNSPLRVVLDGIKLTALGEKGGYFYKVFINLPEQAGVNQTERAYLIGMVGAFEISVAKMKASMQGGDMQGMHTMPDNTDVRLVFPITEALRRIWPTSLDKLTVSFVRVDGARQPAHGNVVKVRDFRVEADSGR
jgi:tyrosinase